MDIEVRQATLKDAEKIFALINLNRDLLVPRSMGNIVENIDRFVVAESEGVFAGTALEDVEKAFKDVSATETGKAYARLPYEISFR